MSEPREPLSIRKIRSADDAAMAAVIRRVMPEFGATGEGFAIVDPEVDGMTAAYSGLDRAYHVVVDAEGAIFGGAGFAPLVGSDPAEGTCELRKMYFLAEARGGGLGRRLLRQLLAEAREAGHRQMYIETLSGMDAATGLYRAEGFRDLEAPLGNTGHFGCNTWMIRDL